jgi:hypothetical protein
VEMPAGEWLKITGSAVCEIDHAALIVRRVAINELAACLVQLLRVEAEQQKHDVAADHLRGRSVPAQPPPDVLGEKVGRREFVHADHRRQPLEIK